MAVKPKLAMIPSGYKGGASSGDLYSVLPSDGVGDFDFSRSGNATRINKDGLIETVDSNVPRLNYPLIDGVVSGCPSLLLEPESTNLLPYSEFYGNGSGWSKLANVSTTDNAIISPDGTLNASRLTFSGSGNNTQFYRVVSTTGSKQVLSLFIKYISGSGTGLRLSKSSNVSYGINLEFSNNGETLTGAVGGSVDYFKIEDYGNKWFRVSVVLNWSSSDFEYNLFRYSGTGTDVYAIWGLQLEGNSSYATSYIPTPDTYSSTRLAETCNGAGTSDTFNDSSGVLMIEASAKNDAVSKRISISDGSFSNRISLDYTQVTNLFNLYISNEIISVVFNVETNNKLAFKYKNNDCSLFLNGFKVGVLSSVTVPVGLDTLQFTDANETSSPFYGNTKQLQYFDTTLTDSELEQLTSWTSFNEMATAQQYVIL